MAFERSRNAMMQKRLDLLESQLEEARNQLAQMEDKSVPLRGGREFLQALAGSLNRSGWICEDSEEEILGVIRRVLATLTTKAETCSRLQTQVADLTERLISSERCVKQLQRELQSKRSRSPAKSVGFSNSTTDLEDSHARLVHFIRQLTDRLPLDATVLENMSISEKREYILDCVEKICAPSAKTESELAPRLHKRVQRLQDDLVSRDLQLQTWRQKAAKLEEQLVLARKGEAEAVEKHALAEQRISRLRKQESEVAKLREESLQLRIQLKDSKDVKHQLEEKSLRVSELENSIKNLEELRQRQAIRIDKLVYAVESEKTSLQQEENQRRQFTAELRDANQLLEELRTENEELHNFRDIMGRLLGMRVEVLEEPNKEILRGVEKLLQESGRSSLNRTAPPIARNPTPRRMGRGGSAGMGSMHAFSDSEPFPERSRDGPMHHTEIGHARSSLRTSVPVAAPRSSSSSSQRPASPSASDTFPQTTTLPRDTRRY